MEELNSASSSPFFLSDVHIPTPNITLFIYLCRLRIVFVLLCNCLIGIFAETHHFSEFRHTSYISIFFLAAQDPLPKDLKVDEVFFFPCGSFQSDLYYLIFSKLISLCMRGLPT